MIHLILLQVEGIEPDTKVRIPQPIPGYSQKEIDFHHDLLEQAGMVQTGSHSEELTWKGYDLLDKLNADYIEHMGRLLDWMEGNSPRSIEEAFMAIRDDFRRIRERLAEHGVYMEGDEDTGAEFWLKRREPSRPVRVLRGQDAIQVFAYDLETGKPTQELAIRVKRDDAGNCRYLVGSHQELELRWQVIREIVKLLGFTGK